MQFPDDRVGSFWESKIVSNGYSGYWGNHNQVGGEYPAWTPYSFSNRSPKVYGDRIHATPYSRSGAIVKIDKPVVIEASGVDGNGAWKHNEHRYLSHYLPNYVLSPYDLRDRDHAAVVGNLQSTTITKLLEKVADQKINLGENIGQVAQTMEQVLSPLILLLRAYKFARQGNWAGVRSLLGPPREYLNGIKLSQGWLQYYYGWKPLISDVYAGLELIRDTQPVESEPIKVTKVKSTKRDYGTINSGAYLDDLSFTAEVKASVTLRANSSIGGMLNTIGLANPLATAWELTPFSFVADWFIPVGGFLNGLTASNGFDFVTGYYTTKVEITHKSRANTAPGAFGNYPGGPPWQVLDAGNRTTEYKSLDRIPFYTFPLPRLYARENPFTSDRMKSALALMRNLF